MKVLLAFAHPDDESFTCGGTCAKLFRAHHVIKLITATKGEAGLTGNPPLCVQEELGKVRVKEHKKAARCLGISQIFYLGYMDGEVDKISEKELVSRILEILKSEKPDLVITFDKKGGSNHPDHIAVSNATTQAFKQYADLSKKHISLYHTVRPRSQVRYLEKLGYVYDAFGHVSGVPDHEITTIINIEDCFDIKLKALKSHKTQHQDVERWLKWSEKVDMKKEYFQLIWEKLI